jgi:hypothetical protein
MLGVIMSLQTQTERWDFSIEAFLFTPYAYGF